MNSFRKLRMLLWRKHTIQKPFGQIARRTVKQKQIHLWVGLGITAVTAVAALVQSTLLWLDRDATYRGVLYEKQVNALLTCQGAQREYEETFLKLSYEFIKGSQLGVVSLQNTPMVLGQDPRTTLRLMSARVTDDTIAASQRFHLLCDNLITLLDENKDAKRALDQIYAKHKVVEGMVFSAANSIGKPPENYDSDSADGKALLTRLLSSYHDNVLRMIAALEETTREDWGTIRREVGITPYVSEG